MILQPLTASVLVLVTLSGCGLVDSSATYQRTFPEASGYTQVSINGAMQLPLGTTRLNVEGFVVSLFVCPPNADCIANSITVAESVVDTVQQTLFVPVEEPRQFLIDRQYLLSLEARVDTSLQGSVHRNFELLGYSNIR